MRTTSGMSDISGDSERRPLVGLVGRIGWDDDIAWRCIGHEGVGLQDACPWSKPSISGTRRHRDHWSPSGNNRDLHRSERATWCRYRQAFWAQPKDTRRNRCYLR